MITPEQREVARQIAAGDPAVEKQILARLGASPAPARSALPAPTPNPVAAGLTTLLSVRELDGLRKLGAEFYGRVCLGEARAMTLLEQAAKALGIAPDRAVRLAHAVARLVGIRAPVTLAGGMVTDALSIPLFPSEDP